MLNEVRMSRFDIPIHAFNDTLTPLESIVVYLKDVLCLNYVAITELTGRDPRCIGTTYRRAKAKGTISPGYAKIYFPIEKLKDRRYSPAEHVVKFLHEQKLTLAEIGRQLGKDPRTIWTTLNRVQNKETRI